MGRRKRSKTDNTVVVVEDEKKTGWSKGERKRYQRYMENKLAQREKNGEITVKDFPFKKISRPVKTLEKGWVFNVTWETTQEEPIALFGCERFLQQNVSTYSNKTLDEVKADLMKKQMENDNESMEDANQHYDYIEHKTEFETYEKEEEEEDEQEKE